MLGMSTRFRGGMALAALLAVGTVLGAQAPARGADMELQHRLEAIVAAHHGHVALYATQLNTWKTVGVDPDHVVPTASVIKLTVLYEAMEEIRAGKAHWNEPITLKPDFAVNGSGMLALMDAPLTLTLKDVLTLMVVVSDNTATNLMVDRFGLAAINARTASLGLKDTYLYRKVSRPAEGPMPADQPKYGLGKTTPREMAIVMGKIGRCQFGGPAQPGDEAICKTALEMLRNQFYRSTIPRYIEMVDSTENGSAVGNKTGSLNKVRNDVGIVTGKTGPMVISVFTYDNKDEGWTVDNEAEVTIAKLAKEIVGAWSPEGLDAKSMVPGLGLGLPK